MDRLFFQKFVCTTIKPTQLPYQELYQWDGAADFVSDYLNFVPLDPPYELVSMQHGHTEFHTVRISPRLL